MKTAGMLKADLVNQLSDKLCDGSTIENKRRKKCQVKSLKELSRKMLAIKKYPKQVLNIAYSQLLWPERVRQWYENYCVKILDLRESFNPYYGPNIVDSG